jgi:hypothetical protein
MWPCWRLIDAGWASLTELKTTWTIVDLFEANEALDAVLEAKAQSVPKTPKP